MSAMSIGVELETLPDVAAGYPTVPMLLTTDADGRPRVSAVTVRWEGTDAVVGAGRRSVANAVTRPLVSLLWPAPPGEPHALIVDGTAAETADGALRLRPEGAILHIVHRAG
jgi:hypothetical protein